MANKNKKNFDDRLFNYIYNSKFKPDLLEFPLNDEELFKILDGVRSEEEARNRIIARLKKDGNYNVIDDAISAYGDFYPDEEVSPELMTTIANLKYRDISPETMSPEYILEKAAEIASVMGYNGEDGVTRLLTDINPHNLPMSIQANEFIKSKLKSDADIDNFYNSLGYNDEDYALNQIGAILERAQKLQEASKKGMVRTFAEGFVAPYSTKSKTEGRDPSINDLVWDGIDNAASLGSGKLIKGAGKNFIAGAGYGTGIDLGHDILDSLLTKHVYSEGEGDNDISERGDVGNIFTLDNLYTRLSPLMMLLGGVALGRSLVGKMPERIGDAIKDKLGKYYDKFFGSAHKEADETQRILEGTAKEVVTGKDFVNNLPLDKETILWGKEQLPILRKRIEDLKKSKKFKAEDLGTTLFDYMARSAAAKTGSSKMEGNSVVKQFF